jgi:hypothetical protein
MNVIVLAQSTQLSLTVHKRLRGIDELPFDKVVVFDNRYDTTKIKIIEDGLYPIKTISFNKPLLTAIKDYIEAVISNYSKKNNTIYINVKQLRFTNINSELFFWADAYSEIDEHYKLITTVKKSYPVHYTGYLDNAYRRTIIKAIDDLIYKINADYKTEGGKEYDTNTFFQLINRNVKDEWETYPIIIQQTSTNGVYETFDDFKNNKIKSIHFSLKSSSDSTYCIGSIELNNNYHKTKNNLYKHIFAVCYEGNIYFSVFGNFFLKLRKTENIFCFYVPYSHPNMYAQISIKKYSQNKLLNILTATNDPGAGIVGGIVEANRKTKYFKEVGTKNQEIYRQALQNNSDFRTCFLDMDTGDIIYY